jgi:hypothetical protein
VLTLLSRAVPSPARVVTTALALAAALAACSEGANGAGGSPSTTALASASASSAPSASAGCPRFHGATVDRTATGPATSAVLVSAAAAGSDCTDEVTFQFQSASDAPPPGYTVKYVDPNVQPFLDGDPPRPISVTGRAFLLVQLAPASSDDPSQPGDGYRGNVSLDLGAAQHVTMVRKLPDANGTVVWVIGLDGVRPFAVDAADVPTRVTVLIG